MKTITSVLLASIFITGCNNSVEDNCKNGDVQACLSFGKEQLNKNPLVSIGALKKACDGKIIESCLILSDIYFKGEKVTEDKMASFSYKNKIKTLLRNTSLSDLKNLIEKNYMVDVFLSKAFIHAGMKKHEEALQNANNSFKKDEEIVLAASLALMNADDSLKKDKEIVLAAVKQNGSTLEYADDSLKKDKEIVLAAVKQDGSALDYADDSLKKDKEIVLAAVKQTGWVLMNADDSLKKDKEIVLAAVKQNGLALEYADDSLKKDKEIVLTAMKQNGSALDYADDSFKKDKEIVLTAVKHLLSN